MVLLLRPYSGYPAGQICQFPASTEAALIAQKFATNSSAVATAGAATTNQMQGRAAIAAGAASVVITHPQVNATSKVVAQISQAAADGTLTSILRVTPAAGQFTITGNANATAVTEVDWEIVALSTS